jgi:sugar/nucleoside kinase (ribokinase family)
VTGPLLAVGETMALLTTAEVGRLRHASSLTLGVAGAESNVAIGARRLGCPAAWVGRVGGDELGELVVSRIRAEGVDVTGVVRDPDASTSLMIKERRTAAMVRVHYYRRHGPGSRLQPGDLDPAQVAAAAVLHVTGITPALSDSARATVDHAVEPVPVPAVDPVGAGDAFVAGYLAETLAGRPVPERLATAAACGAFAVTVPGDWEGLPTRDELTALGARPGTVHR